MGRKLPLAALCAVILIPALALGCSNGGEKPAATRAPRPPPHARYG